ncbi:MAG: hypothetical protein E7283_09340 [Lachnospiraceae bacterium]|nr:hypothetical protein [Lachnospiraceae bacterium]
MRRKCLSYISAVLVMCLLTACANGAQPSENGTIETKPYGTEDGSEKATGDSIADTGSQSIGANDSETENQGYNPSNSEPTEDDPVDSEIKDTSSVDEPTENPFEKETASDNDVSDNPVESEPVDSENESEKESEPEKLEYTFTNYDSAKIMYASSRVNIRNLPSSKGKKIGKLIQRQPIEVTGECNETGWYVVVYEETIAYVSNKYLSEDRISLEDANDDEVWWDDEEIAAVPIPEPRYEMYTFRKIGSSTTPSDEDGWHFEGGYRYFKWVVGDGEEESGHWVAMYEGMSDNLWELANLIEYIDEGFDWEWSKPFREGRWEGEEVRPDEIMWIYLGGGECERIYNPEKNSPSTPEPEYGTITYELPQDQWKWSPFMVWDRWDEDKNSWVRYARERGSTNWGQKKEVIEAIALKEIPLRTDKGEDEEIIEYPVFWVYFGEGPR